MVQSLKEIVNCPEAEIYAMLRECNMDPSEAVHRLLSQDTFHEVKSKRDKKKETKETPEFRSRALNSSSNRGVRGVTDCAGRLSPTQLISSDDGVSHGKSTVKKENGASSLSTSSILGPGVSANNLNRRSPFLNGSAIVESMTQAAVAHDGVSLPSQPSAVSQNNCFGGPGHVTMADIVKRGRPQGKPPSASIAVGDSSYTPHNALLSEVPHHSAKGSSTALPPLESKHDSHASQDLVAKDSAISHQMGIAADRHISHDDWSLVEESPAGSGLSVVEASAASAVHEEPSESSALLVDGVNMHVNHHLDGIHILEGNANSESLMVEPIRSASAADRQAKMDNSGDSSLVDDSLNNMNLFQSQRHAFEHHEVEDVNVEISSAAASMQQLSLHTKDLDAPSMVDHPAVIIPNHLQVTNADCSHLSFGSFGSGVSAAFSAPFPSKPLKGNLEMAPVSADAALVDQQETSGRSAEYYDNGQLRPTASENVNSRTGTSTRNYDTPSASQPEVIGNGTLDSTDGLQYNIPSISAYLLPRTAQSNVTADSYAQTNSQLQNLASFSSLSQPYNNPLSNNLSTSTLPPVRNFDLPFSPFLTTQSMPTQYSTSTSSLSGQTISMAEVMKSGVLSSQTSQQTLPSTSIPAGPALPQHLPVHPYSQPTLPVGHFANMIGYPFLPQSYTYVPSAAFQQTYTGNGAMHQSLASLHSAGIKYNLPQYKSGVSATSLPQSAALGPGYGGFGNSTTIPGSYALNPTPSANLTIDEALNSRYKEASHYVLQQSENPAMWAHGAVSRTMPALPASTFYSFLGQNQLGGFRQGQQSSPLGNLGYPNHSQAGVSQEHQQNPGEGNLNGSQGAQSQQTHQFWQHSY